MLMTKKQLIEALIQDDLTNIRTGDMERWLEDILHDGFIGYKNQSITELTKEYDERELENQLMNDM